VAVPPALQPVVDDPAHAALFVDFDGSLAPIVLDPAAAAPLPAARAALARLVPVLARVAVVSGRPAAFLRDALAIDGLDYAGTYGLERVVAGEVTLDERVRPFVDAIAQAADEAEAALPGLLVERKGDVAVTVHWRDQPERGEAVTRWAAEAAPRLGLEAPLRGRMAVELRPPVPVDKGTTVADLARGMRTAAFAGDDAGDLPAFAALRALAADGTLASGVSIGVTSDESPPEVRAADVVVEGPAGLAALFDALADAITGSSAGLTTGPG
jgi:trehalose 6-phosphate phosphatase